jgi:hypothetical protein
VSVAAVSVRVAETFSVFVAIKVEVDTAAVDINEAVVDAPVTVLVVDNATV